MKELVGISVPPRTRGPAGGPEGSGPRSGLPPAPGFPPADPGRTPSAPGGGNPRGHDGDAADTDPDAEE